MKQVNKTIRIDSHMHILPQKRMRGLLRWILSMAPDHPVPESVTGDDLLKELSQQGVTHFFNLVYPLKEEETDSLNQYNADFCENIPGAIPFASMHQDTPDKVKVAEKTLSSYPFIGFKFHPTVQGFDPWDHCMDSLYDFLQEAGKPVIMHTGFGELYGRPMPAKELKAILKRYPRLPIVFVHMAFPEISEAFSMLDEFPNLYLDATLVIPLNRPEYHPLLSNIPGGRKSIDTMIEMLEIYKDRVMYGSDHPVGMGRLSGIYKDVDALPVSNEVKDCLCSGTAMEFITKYQPDFDWSRNLSQWEGITAISQTGMDL